MATFGRTAVGATSNALETNKLSLSRYPKALAGTLSKLTVYIEEGANTGTVKLKALVYTDASGTPAALLAEGTEVLYKHGEGSKWVDLPLPSAPDALGSFVHIGFKLGGVNNVAKFPSDAIGAERDHHFKEWTYATAAPVSFGEGEGGGEVHKGTGGFNTSAYSIYATYVADPTSVAAVPALTNTVGIPINDLQPAGINVESWASNGLPTGLSIDPSTGRISGTPSAVGASSVTLKGKGEASTGEVTFAWNVVSVATAGTFGGFTPFSPLSGTLGASSSPFNLPVGPSPSVLGNSAAMVKWLLAEVGIGLGVAHSRNQFPTVYAKDTDPQVEIVRRATVPAKEPNGFFHQKVIRIPAAAKCQSNGDKHLQIVLCASDCVALNLPFGSTCDIWQCSVHADGTTEDPQETITYEAGTPPKLKVSSCGRGYLLGSLAPPPGGASVASNFDLNAGVIRGPELKAGDIKHALVAVVKDVQKAPSFVYPASHTDGSSLDPRAPAMGQRFYLAMNDNEIVAAGLPHPFLVAVAKALAHYGFYIEDTGSTKMAFRTENDNMYTAFGAPGYMSRVAEAQGLMPDSEGVLLDYSPLLPLMETKLRAIGPAVIEEPPPKEGSTGNLRVNHYATFPPGTTVGAWAPVHRRHLDTRPGGDPLASVIVDGNGDIVLELPAGEYLLWAEVKGEGRAIVLAERTPDGPYASLRERVEAKREGIVL